MSKVSKVYFITFEVDHLIDFINLNLNVTFAAILLNKINYFKK